MRTDKGVVHMTEEAFVDHIAHKNQCSKEDAQAYADTIRSYDKVKKGYLKGKVSGEEYVNATVEMLIAEMKMQGVEVSEELRHEIERTAKQHILAMDEHYDKYHKPHQDNLDKLDEAESNAENAEANRNKMRDKLKKRTRRSKTSQERFAKCRKKGARSSQRCKTG